MTPELKDAWITALTDDAYSQIRGRLRNGNGYCCLGVLCDVYRKLTGIGEWMQTDIGSYVFAVPQNDHLDLAPPAMGYSNAESLTTIPVQLRRELNLPDGEVQELVRLNDSVEQSFPEIAKYVKRSL